MIDAVITLVINPALHIGDKAAGSSTVQRHERNLTILNRFSVGSKLEVCHIEQGRSCASDTFEPLYNMPSCGPP